MCVDCDSTHALTVVGIGIVNVAFHWRQYCVDPKISSGNMHMEWSSGICVNDKSMFRQRFSFSKAPHDLASFETHLMFDGDHPNVCELMMTPQTLWNNLYVFLEQLDV